MSILIFLIVSYLLLCFTLGKLFEKAGVPSSKAWIPGVNVIEWCKLIGKPTKEALWLLFPIVNIFTFTGMAVDLVRSFGKFRFVDTALAVIYAPLSFFLTARDDKSKYLGPTLKLEADYAHQLAEARTKKDTYLVKKLEANNPYQKGALREWVEAIVFAVFAAAFIRMFLIEAYTIPTSSMESSLLVGDYLFVSKAHYGIRTPMTVAQLPLLHNRIPFLDKESYLKSPSLGYHRLPALTSIKNNDPFVFNYPEGDSVYVRPERTFSVHDLRRNPFLQQYLQGYPLVVRPIDKRDHYIKRCVAIAGDTLEIRNKQLYINGVAATNPTHLQYTYRVLSSAALNLDKLKEFGVNITDNNYQEGLFNLTKEQIEKIKSLDPSIRIEEASPIDPVNDPNRLFPHDPTNFNKWSVDNFGPLYVPKEGVTVSITPQTIAPYRRIIAVYENNKLEERDGKIFINEKEASTYTFQQNYYWAMGDNRHNSEDSRVWGFVPEDHVVGKPLFIWFSTKNANAAEGIRWDRIFTSANKM
ncbi:MAG: signal peptidase I [Saprospiraceae bacterium]|nr:signal peptidase I [Saprospiraceae bacterium]MBP7679497.1 signal peptidase I [Saprospiraceae bacterium]